MFAFASIKFKHPQLLPPWSFVAPQLSCWNDSAHSERPRSYCGGLGLEPLLRIFFPKRMTGWSLSPATKNFFQNYYWSRWLSWRGLIGQKRALGIPPLCRDFYWHSNLAISIANSGYSETGCPSHSLIYQKMIEAHQAPRGFTFQMLMAAYWSLSKHDQEAFFVKKAEVVSAGKH